MSNNDGTCGSDYEAEMLTALVGSDAGASVNPTQYRQTDAGNADLFVDMFGNDLRYVEIWRAWMVWNGARWIEASDIALTPFAKQATEHMLAWAIRIPEGKRAKLRQHALQSQRRDRLRAMIDLAKGNPTIRAEPSLFDANPYLLGCEKVTVDLRGEEPKVYIPIRQDYISKNTGVDPDSRGNCPNWLALLNWAFDGDPATVEHLQRIAGYILTGDVSEEKLFAFFGDGANAKTTVAMTLFDMLGSYAGRARSTLLMEAQGEKGAASPDVAALHGKRLVVVSETDEQCTLAEAQVKAISSNEPIAARRLHRDPFTFVPTHKTMLMTNHRPFVKGTDDGIWRRLNIIAFEKQIDEGDRVENFRDIRLRPELRAILAWAIRGYFMWRRDGLKPSPMVKTATASYRGDMDFIAQWLAERTVADPHARISRTATYGDYECWAKAERAPVLGNRRFGEELHRRGYITVRGTHGVRVVHGLRLTFGGGLHVVPTDPVVQTTAGGQ